MKFNRGVIMGIVAGVIVSLASFLFLFIPQLKNANLFYFILGIGLLLVLLPFVVASMLETRTQREKNEMFLEFSRSLVESVSSGTPISKSIVNMRAKNFGSLGPHVEKLSNQIQLGIPLQQALETFAHDTESKTIIRAITLIREADKTGGDINTILESVARSVSEIEKLKAERRSAISSIVMEGYIIFLIFIVIMIVVEVQIVPMTAGISEISSGSALPGLDSRIGGGEGKAEATEFGVAFLSLLVVQGLFAGLVIGKLAEGDIKAGIKHSFILVAMAILISTGSKLIF